jgi:hypothetical protein
MSIKVVMTIEPRKRAHSPQVLPDGSASQAAGLASVSQNGKLPYGRRFPVPTSRDCRGLQSTCQHTRTFNASLCHIKHKGGKVKKPDAVVQGARSTFLRGCS